MQPRVLGPQLDFWQQGLKRHPDKSFVNRILNHVENGVPRGYQGPDQQVISQNWKSAEEHYDSVCDFVQENLLLGRVDGPVDPLPKNFRCSPLGAFQRRRSQKVRVIHDLSYPAGLSVNDGINKDDYTMKYTCVDDAVKLLSKYKDPHVCKTDLRNAYMSCEVQANERHLLGFSWALKGQKTCYYQFATLPHGLSSAPRLFSDIMHCVNG